MNIAIFSSYLPSTYIGGAEILTELVAKELVARGHTITIYTGGKQKTQYVHGYCIKTTPFLYPVPFRTLLLPIRSLLLRQHLKSDAFLQHADIIQAIDVDSISLLSYWKYFCHTFVAVIQDYGLISPENDLLFERQNAIPRPTGKTKIIRRKDFFILSPKNLIPYIQGQMKKYMRKRCVSHIRYAICVSHFVEQKLKNMAPHIQTSIIGNGVPNTWFHMKKTQKDIDILYVGKLVWYKGIETLLYAIKQVTARQHVRVSLIGGGETAVYKQLIQTLHLEQSVQIMSEHKHPHMIQFYRRAKIVVVPSLWSEPCGRTVIEGMTSGCSVIATNVGGTPESIRNNTYGILIPPNDVNSLTAAIHDLLSHESKRRTIGTQAKRYAQKFFTIQYIAKKYEAFYRLILETR